MWAWTKSCIFRAGSPQSHLVLCLTPKSHDMASFIPPQLLSQPGTCCAAELFCVPFRVEAVSCWNFFPSLLLSFTLGCLPCVRAIQ